MNVPHWLLVPHVLKTTDLIAVVPKHLANGLMDAELRTAALPFRTKSFEWRMYWHRRHDENKANQWLRERMQAASTSLTSRRRVQ